MEFDEFCFSLIWTINNVKHILYHMSETLECALVLSVLNEEEFMTMSTLNIGSPACLYFSMELKHTVRKALPTPAY